MDTWNAKKWKAVMTTTTITIITTTITVTITTTTKIRIWKLRNFVNNRTKWLLNANPASVRTLANITTPTRPVVNTSTRSYQTWNVQQERLLLAKVAQVPVALQLPPLLLLSLD